MKTKYDSWKQLTMDFNKEMSNVLQQLHHAAQYIALAGRHLIPRQTDDSNTNMQYDFEHKMFVGNELPKGLHIALRSADFKLCILDRGFHCKHEISLDGKSKEQVFKELKSSLKDLGVDVSGFTNKLHYEIPLHQLDKGVSFSINDKRYLRENTFYRHNAEIVINEAAKAFDQEESVKTWPHHFDTGSNIPISRNNKGEVTQSIGIGWAIADSMVNEPYYYISFWSAKPDTNFKDLPALEAGRWMIPEWNGAVLKHSEIIKESSPEKQQQLVNSFFTSGISILTNLLKK